jgi:hypothetical protein
MSDIKSIIIGDLWVERGNMATIVGRYKGSMEFCVSEIREIASFSDMSEYAKNRLEAIAFVMEKCIDKNEQLWKERYQSKEATAK